MTRLKHLDAEVPEHSAWLLLLDEGATVRLQFPEKFEQLEEELECYQLQGQPVTDSHFHTHFVFHY